MVPGCGVPVSATDVPGCGGLVVPGNGIPVPGIDVSVPGRGELVVPGIGVPVPGNGVPVSESDEFVSVGRDVPVPGITLPLLSQLEGESDGKFEGAERVKSACSPWAFRPADNVPRMKGKEQTSQLEDFMKINQSKMIYRRLKNDNLENRQCGQSYIEIVQKIQ